MRLDYRRPLILRYNDHVRSRTVEMERRPGDTTSVTIFKSCDIRGTVPQQWNADDAHRIGRSLGKMVYDRDERTIYVGGDYRHSTQELKSALIDGLLKSGVDVRDVGQLPTPVVYFAARQANCGSVAIVTASHNPAEYNGVKFMVANQPAVPELVIELQQVMAHEPSYGQSGHARTQHVLPDYERWLARQMSTESPTTPPALHVVVDTMYGACSRLAPRALESHGFRVSALRNEIVPDFKRMEPNPARDANLESLVLEVKRLGADAGIALDGDGDRVIFVDGAGRIARPEQVAVLLVRQLHQRPTVVYDLKCASIVARAVEAVGGRALMQPSGYGFIKSAMLQHGAQLGVEASGHHFWDKLSGGDDGLFTALVVLDLLRSRQLALADLCVSIGWPAISPDIRIPFLGDTHAVLDHIAATCGGWVVRIDGVRAEYEDRGWALARASITEPAMTFRFEGRDPEQMRRIAKQFLSATPDVGQRVLEIIDD